jgi:metal-sulfur cluster biosynthetic enzyme
MDARAPVSITPDLLGTYRGDGVARVRNAISPNPSELTFETPDDPLASAVWKALNEIKDPCHVLSGNDLSIVDLGLINRVDIVGDRLEVGITFTETSCVFAYRIVHALEDLAPTLPGVSSVKVVPETYPLWTEARLSAKARALYADKAAMFGFVHNKLR